MPALVWSPLASTVAAVASSVEDFARNYICGRDKKLVAKWGKMRQARVRRRRRHSVAAADTTLFFFRSLSLLLSPPSAPVVVDEVLLAADETPEGRKEGGKERKLV
jgi:hypothetical protein